MGGEQDPDGALGNPALDQFGDRGAQAVNEGLDESGVIEELAHLVDLQLLAESGLLEGHREVLAILPTARVRAVSAGRQADELGESALIGFGERVAQVRVPVAVAPEHREIDPAGGELGLQCRLQHAILLVDRADAAEVSVVVRDLLETLIGDATPSRHVAQERDDVVLPLGASEPGEDDRVVGRGGADVLGAPRGRIRRRQNAAVTRDDAAHARTSGTSSTEMRRPVKNGISSRTCRRASVLRR